LIFIILFNRESKLFKTLLDINLKKLEDKVMNKKELVNKLIKKLEDNIKKSFSKDLKLAKKTLEKKLRTIEKRFYIVKEIKVKSKFRIFFILILKILKLLLENDKAIVSKNIVDVREKLGFLDKKEWLEWLKGLNFKFFW
jgi:hypothetical protein